ncbi:MAG: NAD(P)-binding domain-containing protein [Myxococcales bacterium]|nr:NAD(P)-binding domain-containing protein [Myxococcales bacterium]MCB9641489.1 NAD(P)-binding domain-containing protein [Myxococcales bacterium]
MKIGILGTGMVGQAIGGKLVELGHEVKMGSRSAGNEKAVAWVQQAGSGASEGSFADAATFGEMVFHCALGTAALEILEAAGHDNLKGKILVDLTNPLDFSKGMPPSLFVFGTDSLGERIQAAIPETKVVKTLNTIANPIMINPQSLGQDHDVFVSGNDPEAKAQVTNLLKEGFGWSNVVDLGDISTSRGTEAYLLMWLRLWQAFGDTNFNIKIVRQ